jgi:hypothetical protein
MQKFICSAIILFLFATVSHAQEVPAADVSGGYSFLFIAKGFTLKMNGGSGAVAFNINHWLGVTGDFGVYDGSPGIPGLVGETYTFGPRFSYRRWNRLTPFAQAVIGGGHANTTNGGFLGANNAFAFGGGAGGDLGLDRAGRFALRGQMDLLDFRANGINTGTVRLSAGIVFRLGKR